MTVHLQPRVALITGAAGGLGHYLPGQVFNLDGGFLL